MDTYVGVGAFVIGLNQISSFSLNILCINFYRNSEGLKLAKCFELATFAVSTEKKICESRKLLIYKGKGNKMYQFPPPRACLHKMYIKLTKMRDNLQIPRVILQNGRLMNSNFESWTKTICRLLKSILWRGVLSMLLVRFLLACIAFSYFDNNILTWNNPWCIYLGQTERWQLFSIHGT